MNRQGPTVVLYDERRRLWQGPLRAFLDNNDLDASAARDIGKQLRRYGNAAVGGGSSGAFVLRVLKRDRHHGAGRAPRAR